MYLCLSDKAANEDFHGKHFILWFVGENYANCLTRIRNFKTSTKIIYGFIEYYQNSPLHGPFLAPAEISRMAYFY